MAAIAVLPSLNMQDPRLDAVPEAIEMGNADFDPKTHIAFVPPSQIYSMQDLNLPEDTGVSTFAVSEPFALFTPEAVHRMRAEVLSDKVWANCQYSSKIAHCQLRGFAPK